MPWTTEYIPLDESGFRRLNSVRFGRTNPQQISVGEGTMEIPASWLYGDPSQLYPQLAPAISAYDAEERAARERYDATFNEGTPNAFLGIDPPDFYQQLRASGVTPEQFVQDWANTFPADQRSHAPQLVTGADGRQYVKWDQHDSKPGVLDQLSDKLPMAAVTSVLGVGGADLFGGLAPTPDIGAENFFGFDSANPWSGAGTPAVGGGGGGLIPGLTPQEALTYVQGATDGLDAISRLAEVAGGSADAGASALGFPTADAALQQLVPNLLNAAVNGVPTTTPTTPPTPSTPPTPPRSITDDIRTVSNVVGAATGIGAIAGAANTDTSDPYAAIRADEEARQNRIRNSVSDIRSQFGRFDDNYLRGISRSYLDYYLPQLNEQAKEARRSLIFSTPAAGTSSFARRSGKLETDIGRQETNIRSQADQQAEGQRAKLANAEETLVSQAEGAGGIADAGSRAASMADIASKPEPYSPLGQLFATYTGNVANAAQAERLGYRPTGIVPNIFSRPGGRSPVVYQ